MIFQVQNIQLFSTFNNANRNIKLQIKRTNNNFNSFRGKSRRSVKVYDSLQDRKQQFEQKPKSEYVQQDTDLGNGGGNGSETPNTGYSGDGSYGGSQEILAILAAHGKSIESFPGPFQWALNQGKVSKDQLMKYLELEGNIFYKVFLPIEGFQERFLGDPGFLVKLAIEVGIGICTKTTAEYTKRKDNFFQEIDFVFANLTMAIIADTMLVWLPAPTLSFRKKAAAGNGIGKLLSSLPTNAFQVIQPGMPKYTLGQRLGAIGVNGAKLFAVGTFSSLFGVGLINAITFIKQNMDPNFNPLNPPQDIVKTSLIYGSYMASSSNLRYQILAGIVEERGVEKLFAGNKTMCALLSFVFRTSNTFLGSVLWIDYIRLFGMQKGGDH